MPEMRFRVRWPDESETDCYSPSLVIREYLTVGEQYSLEDFVSRSRTALEIAGERVFQKFGFHCTGASAQIQKIEEIASRQLPDPAAQVLILEFRDK
jgi:uncharacterized repeat protein (TIGR04042 family)